LKSWKQIVGIFAVFALVVGLFGLVGCGGGGQKKDDTSKAAACACGAKTPADATVACTCDQIKKDGHGWCAHCGGGMCDGKPSTCKDCATAGKMCAACAAKAAKKG
jgi:hypothetical protein